jgi:outer membrane protein assembly factor BamB
MGGCLDLMNEGGAGSVLKQMFRAILLLGVALTGAAHGEAVWPEFRGPGGNGIVAEGPAPMKWSETENVTWKTPLPGKGWSSPVVVDGQVWMTTAMEVEATEEETLKMLKDSGVEERKFKELQTKKAVTLKALCVDLATGRLVREIELASIASPSPIHHFNSYASPTAVIDGARVICHFGAFGTFCLNRADGSLVWKRVIKIEHGVGPGSSPMIHGDKVILICDGTDAQFVAALNKDTGEEVWRTPRPPMDAETGDRKKSYSTPIAITDSRGRSQLICMSSQWLVSLAPDTGKEIWRVRHGTGFSVVPRPVYGNGIVYVCTGYGKPQLWAVKVDGEGDVTETHVVWKEIKRIPAKPSPLLAGGDLYVTDDAGIVSCFDAADGTLRWQERVGGNFTASPILAGGKLYFASESGKVTLLEPSAAFQVAAENEIDGKLMASPVVVDGVLLLRSEEALYRIESKG